jgi:ABC-2 type transport system ATP-binding protein
MNGAAKAIEISGLTRRFPGVVAVDRVSFDVDAGEIFGLVGPDGAGKTTMLRMLAGLLAPSEGKALVAGSDVARQPAEVQKQMSYMPQRFGLYEDLTVDENIRFYADLFGVPRARREERATRLLAAAGMSPFRGRLAGKLSGGMKQKLGLVCALVHTPRVLLLDEPTNGVDPVSRREFWEILYSLQLEGVTILISTSYLDEAERCQRVGLLNEGRLLLCDTPEALKRGLRGALIAVNSPEPRAARDALEGTEGVSTAVLVGDGVHLVVDDGPRRIPQLRERLAAAGVPVDEISEAVPSIEDLFVSVVGRDSGGVAR